MSLEGCIKFDEAIAAAVAAGGLSVLECIAILAKWQYILLSGDFGEPGVTK